MSPNVLSVEEVLSVAKDLGEPEGRTFYAVLGAVEHLNLKIN